MTELRGKSSSGLLWVPSAPAPSTGELLARYRMALESIVVVIEESYETSSTLTTATNIAKAAMRA